MRKIGSVVLVKGKMHNILRTLKRESIGLVLGTPDGEDLEALMPKLKHVCKNDIMLFGRIGANMPASSKKLFSASVASYDSCFRRYGNFVDVIWYYEGRGPLRLLRGQEALGFFIGKAERRNGRSIVPVDTLKFLLEVHSKADEITLDPFCKSGEVLEAALLAGRKAIGIVSDAADFAIIEKKLLSLVVNKSKRSRVSISLKG